jgi:hypothetical protein
MCVYLCVCVCVQMLTPLVVSGLPHMSDWLMLTDMTGLMEWYNIVSKYKEAVWAWMQKHDKHTRVSGDPLV